MGESFINNQKNKGPKIGPCGVPCLTSSQLEYVLLLLVVVVVVVLVLVLVLCIKTHWDLSVR
jgi:hypothetical protein